MDLSRKESWPVPYLSHLESTGIQPGQTLIVKGKETGETFDLNLMNGNDVHTADIALHISVRLKDKSFVLNSKQNGTWGKEEKKKNPFKDNEPFDLRVRAHDNKFEIFANQKEIAEFDHRQPITTISHLFIDGNIELHNVTWGGKYYPVPYESKVDGKFLPSKKLFISGVPEKKGKGFAVELVNSSNEVSFSFDIRFNEKHVVRNAQINGVWGNEEKAGAKIPFEKDIQFDLIIVNEPYSFQVYVNGQHFCAFAHRSDPNNITSFRINGDVELQGVFIK